MRHAMTRSGNMLKVFVLSVLVLGTAAARAAASDEGVSAGQFLRIGVDARSAALGDTGAAASGARALFYNPAGLGDLAGTELYFSHANWIGDTGYSNLAFAGRRGASVYGLAVSYLSAPSTEKYDKLGNRLSETYSASDMAVTLGYSAKFSNGADLGINVKHISSRLETESAYALAADAGIKASPVPGKLTVGFAAQNVGGRMKYRNEEAPLPTNFKLGGQYTLVLERDPRMRKTTAFYADLNHMQDAGFYANAGVDFTTVYEKKSSFSLRLGYRTNAMGDSSGLSAGLGLDISSYLIDYAYVPMGDLGNTHRLSLTVRFNSRRKTP